MKRRWWLVILLCGAAAVVVLLILNAVREPPPPQASGKEDPTQKRIDELIAELHGMHARGNLPATVQTPHFWEVVGGLEKNAAMLEARRSPVVDRLLDFFRDLPEGRHIADVRRKLFAALTAIDPAAPDRLVEQWLLEKKGTRQQIASVGAAIVPALQKAARECPADHEPRQNGLAGALADMGAPVLPAVCALLQDRNPGARLVAVKALTELGRQGCAVKEELERALNDEDPRVRQAAEAALAG
jgi:hypothetical protein